MFVRTDEGIYELTDNMTIETGVYSFFGKVYNTTKKHLFRNDNDLGEFVAQSENLDELCDVVVETKGTTGDYKHYIYEGERYEKLKPKIIDDIRTQDFNAYGAIWTSKGLIYVAKMDSEGKLVLI